MLWGGEWALGYLPDHWSHLKELSEGDGLAVLEGGSEGTALDANVSLGLVLDKV